MAGVRDVCRMTMAPSHLHGTPEPHEPQESFDSFLVSHRHNGTRIDPDRCRTRLVMASSPPGTQDACGQSKASFACPTHCRARSTAARAAGEGRILTESAPKRGQDD